jgi:lysozyme family protein
MTFQTAFDRLMNNEGGYVNDPKDPGGETKWGISKRSYPNLDIRNLTREQAQQIYLVDFWQRGGMDKFADALAFQVFDAAVNHGIETAIRLLQRAADVADDGHIGSVTIAAINGKPAPVMVLRFIAQRIRFWTKLSTWDRFGKGWANRAADDLVYASGDI